ncbi:TetR/AcrR family transcriptional regulator [Deinococcus peraridilitoris]|uniref:Transcriptional regulator n=1 Tax=Deinococcus peraridilitoris (strain DSM 19664 / LMG 22246 / CIP 109416 / KR-200) TaxID=937777 RepID=L0A2T2_DEIPD|nr:TetR/AcrR family transcriptional regulator [Deinococcus peraridilitoris]AFZ67754.1 transcriptional regulator [Deinococcus peraridilitoris DSM 19664]
MNRSTPEQWLSAALELVVHEGASALTVEKLTSYVGRTKGSFYHHFQNLTAFKAALLEHIEEVGYRSVTRLADEALDPHERFARLADEVASGSPAFETALRGWASYDAEVASLLERMDDERLTYLQRLLSEVTGDSERGAQLARLTYAVYLGALQLRPAVSSSELRAMLAELQHLMSSEQDSP